MLSFPRAPWTLWLVVVMTVCAVLYQYPHWRVPEEYKSFFPVVIVGIVVALCLGVLYGGRWAFVVMYLTVWIFPFETYYLGIKPLFRGSVLTGAHVLAVVLLALSWRYFWEKQAGEVAGG